MFLSTSTLGTVRPTMASVAMSAKLQSLAASLDGSLSDDAVAKLRKELESYAEELQSEFIDDTLDVSCIHSSASQMYIVLLTGAVSCQFGSGNR